MESNESIHVVTGATDGIGRATALALAERGARVIAIGRDASKGHSLLQALGAIGAGHRFIAADLSLMSEVARVAREVLHDAHDKGGGARVDGLVHCAGIMSGKRSWTSEGIELNFATNYLSRFLLTRLLEPALRASPDARVVVVAAPGMHPDVLDFDDLQLQRRWSSMRAFRQSQFANDLFVQAAQTKLPFALVAEVNPGVVKTNLWNAAQEVPLPLRPGRLLTSLFGTSATIASETPTFLALAPDARAHTDRVFGAKKKPRKVPRAATNVERQAQLWRASEQLVDRWLTAA